MLDVIIQHLQLFVVMVAAASLIVFFGAIVAGAVYAFIWAHWVAYKWLKEVYHGIVPSNA